MKLIIVESPKKSKTIGGYLGDGFKVLASEGHIRDLSKRGKGGLGIDIENGFKADWEISPGKEKTIASLKAAVAKADEVYLATDPDREGEAISWHLAEVLRLPLKTTKRLQFHEITKPAILAAIEDPKTVDINLVKAQETRRMQDRIIGFRVSSLLQKKIQLQSAGRVQSSTLRMIVDRQAAIDAFVPEEYWTIEVEVVLDGKKFKANLTRVDGKPLSCKSKEEAEAILARIPKTLKVSSLSQNVKSVTPKMAFTTSTMQQEAYNKFKFSPDKTQRIAQKLYEGIEINGEHYGLVTYIRTDSSRISPHFMEKHARPFITETFGKEYVGTLRREKGSKNMQDAHEAIRPTGTHRTPEFMATLIEKKALTADDVKLYRLIYCRAMASLMAPKKVEVTSLILSGNGLDFSLSGSRVLFKGFAVIYGEFDDEESASLPEVALGTEIGVVKIVPEQKFTKPEPQFNEASIVKAMEEKGIGRPSTYASTIVNLKARKYVTSSKGVLTPTDSGKKAVATLKEYFPDIVSTDYTASMESQLDLVEEGKLTFAKAMDDFYASFAEEYKKATETMSKQGPEPTGEMCPVCGRPLVFRSTRKGKGGSFVGCSGFPECSYIQREEKPADEPVGENCPDCGKPLVYKKNRKGERFIGCSSYPTCHYTRNIDGPKAKKKGYTEADYVKPCPSCKDGHLVLKKGKKKEFLGCTNFPRCKHVEWIKDEEK